MNRKGLRQLINQLHLWMGLGSGIILFVVCASGTIYTFRSEIERFLEPEKYYSQGGVTEKALPADSVVAIVERNTGGTVASLMIPGDASMNWQVAVKKKSGTKKEAVNGKGNDTPRPKTYFVEPSTGSIVAEQGGSTSEFFSTVMKLHRWLLMDAGTGRIIVGVATIIFVLILLSGIILWFPARLKNIKQGLTIYTKGNWKRINHDLHNTLGFYSFLVMLIMALTGLCWSFEWYKTGAGKVLGAPVFKGRGDKPVTVEPPSSNRNTASLQSLLQETERIFPYAGNSRLTIPEKDSIAVTITKSATGFFAVAAADKVQLDPYTGEVLKVDAFSDKPLNVQIADSIKVIHTGEIFGTFSKILYFIVCLIATSLPLTGTMIWLNKMKKTKKQINPSLKNRQQVA